MARRLYTLLLWLLLPIVLLRLVVKGFYSSAYRDRWAERFGYGPNYPDRFNVWIHAVSVGEVNAATPLITNLLSARPDCRILVTTMTPTGSERVRSTIDQQVTHCYAPYDYPFAVTRFLQRTSPDVLILMETEIWPNIITQCDRMGTKVLMTNVRMSEKSRRGYARILPVIGLALTKVSEFGVQSDSDRQRLIDLGVSPNRVTRTGSMKFETNLPLSLREVAEAVRRNWGRDRSVIVCGSTHDGEESLLLGLLKDLSEQFPQTLLVLAPRHPERFDQVARLTVRSGFNMARRSQQHGPIPDSVSVQIADTMGELTMLYAAADIAIVGGSLIRIKGIGGHNILEPCAVGVPVIFGPYMRNFSEISQLALARQAGFQIDGPKTLKAQVCTLLRDADLRATTGENGIRMVSENTGATDCTLKLILPYLNQRN